MGFIIITTLLGITVVAVAVYLWMAVREHNGPRALSKAERARLRLAERAIENVKELAYEYRDLDSNLSYRLLDIIKDYEARKEVQ